MLSHTIVFAVLSILSLVAIHAVRMPVKKSSNEEELPAASQTEQPAG